MALGYLTAVVITVVILWLTVKDWKTYIDPQSQHLAFRGIIVSAGLFGTFFGIFFGLLEFNTDDIENGVPRLLDGLRIAFFTSLVGILCSIYLGIRQKLTPMSKEHHKSEKDYLKELVSLHEDKSVGLGKYIEDLGNKIVEAQQESTEHLENRLVAVQEASSAQIIERISEVGQDIVGSQNALNTSLITAVRTIHVRATEQIIKALDEVVLNFNNNLIEQFGENFKRLDDACEDLVKWQERHIDDLKVAIIELNTLSNSAKTSRNALLQTMNDVEALLSAVRDQTSWQKSHRAEVEKIKEQLSDNIKDKVIYDALDKLSRSIENTYRDLQNMVKEQSKELSKSTSVLIDHLEQQERILKKYPDVRSVTKKPWE